MNLIVFSTSVQIASYKKGRNWILVRKCNAKCL